MSKMAGEIAQDATQILKREMRKRIRGTLSGMPRARIEAESAYLQGMLERDADYEKARTIAVYASLSTEVDTTAIVAGALARNKRVFLPRVMSKERREMAMLEVHSERDLAMFERGAYGIPEPPVDGRMRAPHDILLDVVVVPGVAFDVSGARCGHGMGYYDVFLSEYAGRFAPPMPKLIALVLSPQLVEQVPVNDNDYVIDNVIVAPTVLPSVE